MALPTSGEIPMSAVAAELSRNPGTEISLNDTDVRSLAGIAGGQIALSDLYGKSSIKFRFVKDHSASGTPMDDGVLVSGNFMTAVSNQNLSGNGKSVYSFSASVAMSGNLYFQDASTTGTLFSPGWGWNRIVDLGSAGAANVWVTRSGTSGIHALVKKPTTTESKPNPRVNQIDGSKAPENGPICVAGSQSGYLMIGHSTGTGFRRMMRTNTLAQRATPLTLTAAPFNTANHPLAATEYVGNFYVMCTNAAGTELAVHKIDSSTSAVTTNLLHENLGGSNGFWRLSLGQAMYIGNSRILFLAIYRGDLFYFTYDVNAKVFSKRQTLTGLLSPTHAQDGLAPLVACYMYGKIGHQLLLAHGKTGTVLKINTDTLTTAAGPETLGKEIFPLELFTSGAWISNTTFMLSYYRSPVTTMPSWGGGVVLFEALI